MTTEQRLHTAVYATYSGRPTLNALMWAALLYCGEGSVLSHHSAGYLQGLVPSPSERVHVTVPFHRRVSAAPGTVLYRSRRLPEMREGNVLPPRTRIEETVLDLVGRSERFPDALALVARACQMSATVPDLRLALRARPTLRWRPFLLPMLDDIATGAHSLLELHYLRRVERAHSLPVARRQRAVSRGRSCEWTDCHYEEFRTSVELDGRLGHAETEDLWRDMDRDNRNALAGETTLRYGWADVMGRPCTVAGQVAGTLTARGWTGQPRKYGESCRL